MQKKLLYIILIFFTVQCILYGQTITVKNGANLYVNKGTMFYINGGLTVETGATLMQGTSTSDSSTIQLTGNCAITGTYTQNMGSLWFVGSSNQDFSGLSTIKHFILNKPTNKVFLKNNLTVTRSICLVDGLLDIDLFNLTMDINAEIYSKLDTSKYYTSFSDHNSIYCSKGYTGGVLTRKINPGFPVFYMAFPISVPDTNGDVTKSFFAPAMFDFWQATSATYGANPYISMNVHYKEHPKRLVTQTLLKQYWKIVSNDITINPVGGINLKFKYSDLQVQSTELDYQVLYYAPSYPANHLWDVNPGDGTNSIDFTNNIISITRCDFLQGDWTAGDLPVYFSIANGNWTAAGSWSKRGYGGVAAATAPQDYAYTFIGNNKTITVNTPVTVNQRNTIDSTGTISFVDETIMSGTGEFRIKKYGGIEVGAIAGVTTSGATGNVQTTTRNYNYLEHDRSNFAYTNSSATNPQTLGNGLPDTVNKFILRRGLLTKTLNLSKYVTVNNLMHIESGTLLANAHVYLEGNLRVGTIANGKLGYIVPNTYSFTFFGLTQDTIFHQATDSNTINFYDLIINKKQTTGDVVLSNTTGITIRHNLNFHTNNQSQIVARADGSFVQMIGNGTTWATITGAGPGHGYAGYGWVDGELRKYIVANKANQIFEVGDYEYYSPFSIYSADYKDMFSGYASVKVMSGLHPYLYATYANLLIPSETALRYWRVMRPYYSLFNFADKLCSVKAWLVNPDDITNTGSFECMDMAMWDGRDMREGWLYCDPRYHGFNSDFMGEGCVNIRNDKIPGYTYHSDSDYNDNNVFIESLQNAENYKFSPRLVFSETDGDKLVFDYLFGNSGAFKGGYTYYSAKTGFWDDSTTWSTVSHTSTVNAGGTIYSKKYPIRQYDRAYIGGSDTVKLRSTIGNGDYSVTNGVGRYQEKTGPNTYVEADGTLDLGTNALYGLFFGITPGGKLIVGSSDGIVHRDSLGIWPSRVAGNIRTVNRNYNDSISLIYKPTGHMAPKYSSVVLNYPYYNVYCQASLSSTNQYIQTVDFRLQGAPTYLIYNNTGANLKNSLNFTDFSASVMPGSTYSITVNVQGFGASKRLQVWADLDYNSTFDYPADLLSNNNFTGASTTQSFTIPAGADPGGTVMRVIYYDNQANASNSACVNNNSNGEAEDYWLNIQKNTTAITQYSGNGVPDTIRALTVHATRNKDDKVIMSKRTTITDSLYIKSGNLDVSTHDISIYRTFRSDSINPLEARTQSINFIGSPISKIQATYLPTFYNISAQKTNGNDIDVKSNIDIKNNLNFQTNTIVDLFDNKTITLKDNANITSPLAFSSARMIQVTGKKTGVNMPGIIKKEWNTTAGVLKSIIIPVGVVNSLNTAELSFNQTDPYTGIPSLSVQLFDSIHAQSTSTNTLHKFWKITSANLGNLTSRLFKFHYNNSDTNGYASKYSVALYNTLNSWTYNLGDILSAYPSPIIANSTSGNYDQVDGDWTARFRKSLYFSRATGFWNIPANWTGSPSHNGPALPTFPSTLEDSVVIGTGSTGQHTITLVQNVTISGLVVGTTALNPGTLNTNGFFASGNNFSMGPGATLMVTSPDGISAIGQPDELLGNIRTTLRFYGNVANLTNFIYSGTASQVIGSGLPTNINNLTINNTGAVGNLAAGLPGDRVVTINKDLSISGNLTVSSGTLNLQTFTVNSANALGTVSIADNASINIGGTNNMLTAVNNYANYSLTDLSYVEFSGGPQVISQYPVHFDPIQGFGSVNILNIGIKTVNLPMTMRTNLFNSVASTLMNNVGVNQLFVKKSLINRGVMTNEGNIQTCE